MSETKNMRKIIHKIKIISESLLLQLLSIGIKRRSDYIAIGSWGGDRYADNSRYLAEFINSHCPGYHIVWVGNKRIRDDVEAGLPGVIFVEKDTLFANLTLLRCKYMFFSQMHNADISSCNVFCGATTCYLHHGMPIKKWGQDGLTQTIGSKNKINEVVHKITGESIKYDYFVTSSPLHDKTNCSGLAYKGCTEDKNLHTGTPRNDMYFDVSPNSALEVKDKYSSILKFDNSKRIVMYLPTFRRTSTSVFSFSRLSFEQRIQLERVLERHNAILIEKSHVAEKNTFDGGSDSHILCVPSEMNVQELMLFADILISDYSGAFLDFILLDRPVIHYAYDYDYYKNVDSGLYYEIEDFSAGPIAYDYDSLIKAVDEALSGVDAYSEKRQYVRRKYMQYETGEASAKIMSSVIGGTI